LKWERQEIISGGYGHGSPPLAHFMVIGYWLRPFERCGFLLGLHTPQYQGSDSHGFEHATFTRIRRALYRHPGKEWMSINCFSPRGRSQGITTAPPRTLPGPRSGYETNVKGGGSSWAFTRHNTKDRTHMVSNTRPFAYEACALPAHRKRMDVN
jgi:hypothetical protein